MGFPYLVEYILTSFRKKYIKKCLRKYLKTNHLHIRLHFVHKSLKTNNLRKSLKINHLHKKALRSLLRALVID